MLAICAAACTFSTPAESPAPRELIVSAAPAQVFAYADSLLTHAGWTTTLKAHDSELRGEHKGKGEDNGDWMTCESGVGRSGDKRRATRDLRSTVAVLVEARTDPAGTRTRISGGVPRSYSLFPMGNTGGAIDNFTVSHCVSSGRIEALLADSIAARFPAGKGKAVQ